MATAVPPTTNTTTKPIIPTFTKPKMLLLFDHRCLVDMTDGDYLEIAAWEDALSSFGVEDLNQKTFFENMSQRSESDVMKAMCPFTTKLEWESYLNKKRQKMNHDLKDWCFANCVPIPGLTDFIDACGKEFGTAATHNHAEAVASPTSGNTLTIQTPQCLSMWLTPWRLEQAHALLNTASLKSHVSPAVVDSSDFTFLDVLEMFGLRAPMETPITLQYLAKNRGEAAVTQAQVEAFIANREKTLEKVQSCALNDQLSSSSAPTTTKVVVFTNSARLARQATTNGLIAVGISYNSYDQEQDEKVLLDGCDTEMDLLAAGCRVVLPDFSKFHPSYLRML